MFAQQFDHSFNDLFNQYVNVDSSHVDGNKEASFPSGDLDQLFPLDSLSSDCGDLSPSGSTSKRSRQSPQPWSQDLWGQPQDTAASSSSEQGSFPLHDTIHPSAVSDLSLSLDAHVPSSQPAPAHDLPSTLPSTPPQTPRKKACTGSGIIAPKSNLHPRDINARRNLLRKQSFSPSLTRSSRTPKGRMAYPDASAQRYQNLNLRGSNNHLPLSPPPSDIVVKQENRITDNTNQNQISHSGDQFAGDPATEMPQQYDSSVFNQSPAISMPSPSANALARHQQRYMGQSSGTMASSPPSTDEIFSSPHSSASQSLSSWYSDSLGTSGFSFTPDLNGHDAQAWWSPMASRVPAQRQPSYHQPMIASPAPQRPIQNNPEQQNNMFQGGGLMIQFDQSLDMPGSADTSFAQSTLSSSAPAVTQQETPAYSQVPSTPQKFINPTFTTPQVLNPESPRSPSLSPKTLAGHSTSPRNGTFAATTPRTPASLTRTPHRRSYDRKMSAPSTAPKPVKTPSPKGSNKSVSVSFVNFTPSDSKKILTGVAPSGSSKTKARREQEARDRRQKLSEAAMVAIRNAGGDIDSLEAILC